MLRATEEESGGAAILRMDVDSYQGRDGKLTTLSAPLAITFFFPNYDPTAVHERDLIWAHFEVFADWEDLKEVELRQKWIKPLTAKQLSFEYSLSGELFQLSEAGRDEDLYINAGFPITLTLGLPPYPRTPSRVRDGQFALISRGRMYGHVALSDPEFAPRRE